eukprot:548035-Pelagomonas_calceolata.AAC.5
MVSRVQQLHQKRNSLARAPLQHLKAAQVARLLNRKCPAAQSQPEPNRYHNLLHGSQAQPRNQ